jgi:hypothetical protein
MKRILLYTGLILLLAGRCAAARELGEDFYTGLSITGPQKSLSSQQSRAAYDLKNKALKSMPVDEKWELRDLMSQYSRSGFGGMSHDKIQRFQALVSRASKVLSPAERAEVAAFGRLVREGKAALPPPGSPQPGAKAAPSRCTDDLIQAGSASSEEGLFVQHYTCDQIARLAEKPADPGAPGGALLEELKRAGLLKERGGGISPVALRDFAFHRKGRFLFVRYSADGKSLFVSYLYPGKGRDRNDYAPRLSDRSALARWETATGRLMTVLLAGRNDAGAVEMSRDEKTVIYRMDLPGAQKKDGTHETVKNLLYSLHIAGEIGSPRKMVSIDRDDEVLVDAFPALDNIVMSPDGRYVVFSAPFKADPGKGNIIIVETAGGKRHFYPCAYGVGTPGQPNAASVVFSPDGKHCAMGLPEKVGGGGVTEASIKILDARSLEKNLEIRKIPAVTTGFTLGAFIYSPDSRYLVRFALDRGRQGVREFISVDTGKAFCSLSYKDLCQCFSPDGRFYLNFSPAFFTAAFVDRTNCFWLPPGYYPRSFDGPVARAAFSPDGRRIALAGQVNGVNTLQVMEFNEPGEKQIAVFRRAEEALKMFGCGMREEAVAAAEEAIKADPRGLYALGYGRRLADASMPLFLQGELYRRAFEQLSAQKGNRLGLDWKHEKAGLTVTKVNQNTPAQKAGVAVGDIVTGMGGKNYATGQGFLAAYHHLTPDQPVPLHILRAGSALNLTIVPIKGYSRYLFDTLMDCARTALEAGHPAIATEVADLVNGWIREGRLHMERGMEENFLVVKASILASKGREKEAFGLLREHNGFEKYGSAWSAMLEQPGAFYPLLKDRQRLGAAMMLDEYRLLPEPRAPGPPQPYPDLSGRKINAPQPSTKERN